MIALEVGQPWPYPLPVREGMVAQIDAAEEGLSLTLLAIVPGPTSAERELLRRGLARLALTPTAPLLWLALDLGKLSLDAPWSAAVLPLDARPALAAAAERTQGWPEGTRGLVQLYGIDGRDRRIVSLRAVTCSAAWWRVLAGAVSSLLAAAGERVTSSAERDRIVAAEMTRWPATSTADLIGAATAVETGGRA